jgi:hypothetical protein
VNPIQPAAPSEERMPMKTLTKLEELAIVLFSVYLFSGCHSPGGVRANWIDNNSLSQQRAVCLSKVSYSA